MKAKFLMQQRLEGAEALKTCEILQGCGKVMKVGNADKLTQVCNCLLTRDPKRGKMQLIELQCFIVQTLGKERP